MKPKKPLPKEQPFITFISATWCRPKGLAEMLKSVHRQTLASEIEHLVIPDYIGVAPNDAVYGRLPWYAETPRGEYVHVLGDDDVLADDRVVERVKLFARKHGNPDVIVVKCQKGDTEYPKCGVAGEPLEGDIDLCCYVIRKDVWELAIKDYGASYTCDFGFYETLKTGGYQRVPFECLFAVGRVGGGRPEAVDW